MKIFSLKNKYVVFFDIDFAFLKFKKARANIFINKEFSIIGEKRVNNKRYAIFYKPKICIINFQPVLFDPMLRPTVGLKNSIILTNNQTILAWGGRHFEDFKKIINEYGNFFYFKFAFNDIDDYKKSISDRIIFICPKCNYNLETAEFLFPKLARIFIYNLKEQTLNYKTDNYIKGDRLKCPNCGVIFSSSLTKLILDYLQLLKKEEKKNDLLFF